MVTTQTIYGYAAKQNFHSTPMESIISIHSRPGPQVSRHLDYPDWVVTVQLEYFVDFIRVFECSSVCIQMYGLQLSALFKYLTHPDPNELDK